MKHEEKWNYKIHKIRNIVSNLASPNKYFQWADNAPGVGLQGEEAQGALGGPGAGLPGREKRGPNEFHVAKAKEGSAAIDESGEESKGSLRKRAEMDFKSYK